jgi:hypothetical protein
MIELNKNSLVFTFQKVHSKAKLSLQFQRTLRIPNDDLEYPLPPGLGAFPLKHVDDFNRNVPTEWIDHGGVMLPMYQSEAMWVNFHSDYIVNHDTGYPFAFKIAAGKINAVNGKSWTESLVRNSQNYMVSPGQPWLDGYCVEKGVIRQFVAMPLGDGYSTEEQITAEARFGGVQIEVFPMKQKVFDSRFPKVKRYRMMDQEVMHSMVMEPTFGFDMGLAPGGRMRQTIYEDPFDLADWDLENRSRCFVHFANSLVWRAITGELPPTVPFTAKEYTDHGFPWFDYYDDNLKALKGSKTLKGLKSVTEKGKEKGLISLPENETVKPKHIVTLRSQLKQNQVREWGY